MRSLITFLILLLSSVGYAQHQNAKSLIVAWEKSWNTYDLDEVQHLFVNDSSVTYFSSERAGLIHGIDSLVRHHKGFGFLSGGKTSPNKLWLTEIRYLPAAVTAIWHFQRPGSPEQRGPVTFSLHRDAKGLRIAHAHFSNDPKPR
jgi:hypothetical protein